VQYWPYLVPGTYITVVFCVWLVASRAYVGSTQVVGSILVPSRGRLWGYILATYRSFGIYVVVVPVAGSYCRYVPGTGINSRSYRPGMYQVYCIYQDLLASMYIRTPSI